MRHRPFPLPCLALLLAPVAPAQTWVHQYPDQPPTLRDVAAFQNGLVIAVGDAGRVLRSLDRGVTWSTDTVAPGTAVGRLAEVEFAGGATIAAGAGIWRSNDGGVSWVQVDGTEGIIGLEVIGSSHAWALTGDRTVLRSLDGGRTWTSSTVPAGFGLPLLSIDFADTSRGWIGGSNGEMWETLDGGVTWESRNLGSGSWQSPTNDPIQAIHLTTQRSFLLEFNDCWRGNSSGSSFTSEIFPWVTNAQDFDFLDAFGLAVGYSGRIERTRNAALSWQLSLEDGGWEHHGVVILGPGEALVVGEASRVLRTTDEASTWQLVHGPGGVPPTIPWIYQVHAIDADTVVVAGSHGKVLRSDDAGATWELQNAGSSQTQIRSVHFFDDLHGYGVGEKQGFYPTFVSTHDGGQNWFEFNQLGMYDHWDVHATGPNTAIVASDTRIWSTADGGQSWSSVTPSPLGTYHAIDIVGQVGYAIGTKLIKTLDGGQTWTFVEDPATRYFGIAFHDELIGWRVGENGTIDRTTDGGTTWTPQTSGVGTALRQVDTFNANTGLATGDDGVVLLTTDAGVTWTAIDPPGLTTETLYGAAFGVGALWVSGSDAGVWRYGAAAVDCAVNNYCQGKVHSGGGVATLTLFGTPNVSNGAYGVGILDALPNTLALGFESDAGPAAMPLHNGTLCVQPPLTRLQLLSLDASGFGFYTLPMVPAMAGTTRWYQFFFRDPQNPDGTGIGLSDGLRITFCP